MSRIFARWSFDPTVGISQASYLLRLADRLTYRELVLIAFREAAQSATRPYEQAVIGLAVHRSEHGGSPEPTLIAEMNDLGGADLLGVASSDGSISRVGSTFGSSGGFAGIDLNTVRLTDLGKLMYRLMGLELVPDQDLDRILVALRGG